MAPNYPDRLYCSHAVVVFSVELREYDCIEHMPGHRKINRVIVTRCDQLADGSFGFSIPGLSWLLHQACRYRLAAFLPCSLGGSLAGCFVCFRIGDAMHDLERAAEQIAIVLDRINHVCGHRKFRSAADRA